MSHPSARRSREPESIHVSPQLPAPPAAHVDSSQVRLSAAATLSKSPPPSSPPSPPPRNVGDGEDSATTVPESLPATSESPSKVFVLTCFKNKNPSCICYDATSRTIVCLRPDSEGVAIEAPSAWIGVIEDVGGSKMFGFRSRIYEKCPPEAIFSPGDTFKNIPHQQLVKSMKFVIARGILRTVEKLVFRLMYGCDDNSGCYFYAKWAHLQHPNDTGCVQCPATVGQTITLKNVVLNPARGAHPRHVVQRAFSAKVQVTGSNGDEFTKEGDYTMVAALQSGIKRGSSLHAPSTCCLYDHVTGKVHNAMVSQTHIVDVKPHEDFEGIFLATVNLEGRVLWWNGAVSLARQNQDTIELVGRVAAEIAVAVRSWDVKMDYDPLCEQVRRRLAAEATADDESALADISPANCVASKATVADAIANARPPESCNMSMVLLPEFAHTAPKNYPSIYFLHLTDTFARITVDNVQTDIPFCMVPVHRPANNGFHLVRVQFVDGECRLLAKRHVDITAFNGPAGGKTAALVVLSRFFLALAHVREMRLAVANGQ